MTIELERLPDRPMAQSVRIGPWTLLADLSAEEGGSDSGPSPHDLYDAALGACKALTVLWFAKRKGITVTEIRTRVERDDSRERDGTYVLATHLAIGGPVTDAQLAQLQAVAAKCPVHKLMTLVTTQIDTTVERLP